MTEHMFDCDAGLSLVLPERGVAIHNLLTRTFPNMVSIAGGPFRDPAPWLAGVDELRCHDLTAILGCHGLPVIGDEACTTAMRAFRDAMQFVHDQTIRGANHGQTADEILEHLRLPAHLANDPNLTATYADWAWGVRAVWAGRLGWYSGYAEDMAPVPPAVEASKIIAAYGGPDAAVAAARDDAEGGELAWASRLLRMVLRLEPEHEQARGALADCLRHMGQRAGAWTQRNAYLVQARECEGSMDRRHKPHRIGAAVASGVAARSLVEVLRYRVDPLKSQPANLVCHLDLGDGPLPATSDKGCWKYHPLLSTRRSSSCRPRASSDAVGRLPRQCDPSGWSQ